METASRRRSERILLQVRVIVEIEMERERPVRLEAFTLVVNAHGGLLEMGLRVTTGQRLVLDNPSAGRREACKVVGVRKSRDGQLAVAFEFVNPAPQFWPIAFPPVDWHLVKS